MLMFLSLVRPDLRGLHNAGFCCQAYQIRMTTVASFYRSFNAIYGRLGRCASPEVIVHLLSSKCMPVLLYGLDSCSTNVTELRSLEHPVTMAFMKIFQY